jgi:hypothetical protein
VTFANADGRPFRGHIHHPPWPLQNAEVEIETCEMTRLVGIDLPPEPTLAHFAERIDVVGWTLRRL